jgi:peptidoglycan/xylan/chitin deacetylase (PgdA/CDA1 family)
VNAYFTVDVEHDCPPYLTTWRGIEEGMPRLLAMLREEQVPATCFTTGEVARRYPEIVRTIVEGGHELGCHGDTHRSFAEMTQPESDAEIAAASETLRAFAPVVSFRAPYLRFPARYIALLGRHQYALDSSEGRHKSLRASVHRDHGVLRVPASVTSSTLRWPAFARNALFSRLSSPVVLFVHPWEFVNLKREPLRFDCRFKTGDEALECARAALRFFKARGATFARMRDCAAL